MSRIDAFRKSLFVIIAMLAWGAGAQDASDLLKRASDAMGATNLKSIRYADAGVGYTYGQAYKPGMAWPKITVHSHARTINYESGAMRDEITISRAEPLGGGGYPQVAQQKNDEFISGTEVFGERIQPLMNCRRHVTPLARAAG